MIISHHIAIDGILITGYALGASYLGEMHCAEVSLSDFGDYTLHRGTAACNKRRVQV